MEKSQEHKKGRKVVKVGKPSRKLKVHENDFILTLSNNNNKQRNEYSIFFEVSFTKIFSLIFSIRYNRL